MIEKQLDTVDSLLLELGKELPFGGASKNADKLIDAKAALSAMVAEIIGEDESVTRAGNTAQFNSISGQNMLRREQRQRAIAKGFTL